MWLRVAAGLYAVGLLQSILSVLRKRVSFFRPAFGAFAVAAILHFVSLAERAASVRQVPANNFYESASLCAFVIALLFLFVYWRYQFQSLSVFLFPLVFLLTLVGSTEVPVGSWTTRAVRDIWLSIHVTLVLLGYAALLLMAAASIFYLLQEKRLKSKRPGSLFERLPPLGTLDTLISTSMGAGFALITLGGLRTRRSRFHSSPGAFTW
ncbi:MAG: cytochrome c biogenesis protein CcsA [Acidobacteria bacterium]|nr:cytochrome c biogenesis protein CcsA [Acidobacteriota bacterium]